MDNKLMLRRRFLKTSALFAVPLFLPGRALGRGGAVAPNEKITLAGIGIGRRGQVDLQVCLERSDVHFVADSDARRDRRDEVKKMVDTFYENQDCATYIDMLEMLERPDIDAVIIATGDRWHTLASVLAAKAGKDIFCEKPLSLTIQESLSVAEAVNNYGRIFQAGTQRRNIGNFQLAAKFVHEGKLGKLLEVHANIRPPAVKYDWLPAQPEPPREELDWDRWLGPSPWRPYNEFYLKTWHTNFDFHGGGILEWGTHTVDLCQWANCADHTVPVEYWPVLDGDGHRTSVCEARYANGVKLVLRESGWLGLGSCSARYVGEEGWVETGDTGRMEVSSDALRKELRYFGTPGTDPVAHLAEFFDCVRTRKNPSANANVACMTHIANHCAYISWQLGRKIGYDPLKNEFPNEPDANVMRSRAMREPWRL